MIHSQKQQKELNKYIIINKKMIKLEEIEYIMDKTNSEYGTKEAYCLYCNSKEYNSKVGIVHNKECIIQRLRDEIK